MHTDAQRRRMFDEFGTVFSPETRDALMELLPPVGWSDVARTADVTALRGEMAELRAELTAALARLEMRTEARFNQIEARLAAHDARFDSIDARFESIDAKFDRQLVKLASLNLASMIGFGGLVLAAVQIG